MTHSDKLNQSKSWVLFQRLMREEKDRDKLIDSLSCTIAHLHGMQSNRKSFEEFESDLFISLEHSISNYSTLKLNKNETKSENEINS